MQFYPDDWLADTGLRICSRAAKGLWMDCLCLMFNSPERGTLRKQNGSKISSKDLANMGGGTEPETDVLLAELEENGVLSKSPDGVVYNRRMVRDEHLRQVRAAAGRVGGLRGGRPANPKQKKKAKKPPPSPSPSPSPSPGTTDNGKSAGADAPSSAAAVEFLTLWNALHGQHSVIAKCRDVKGQRGRLLADRMADQNWRADWKSAIEHIPKCPFLLGQNERGWKANVDWFLKPGSVRAILEGKYDGQRAGANRGNPGSRTFAAASEQPGKFAGR